MTRKPRLRPAAARQGQRLKALPFNRLIPNILTVLALCAGLTAIRYGFQGQWNMAALAILVSAILDTLDGRVARLLGGATKFGAELDSLSDFVSFGVAPAMVVFLWSLQSLKGLGWVIALVFAVCVALRLARFNTKLEGSNQPSWASNYFTGVPAPAGGGLLLLPMLLHLETGANFLASPVVNGMVAILVGYLMISQLPTYSFKRIQVPHRYVLPFLLLVGLVAALLVTETWITLSVVLITYLVTIPFSVRSHARLKATSGLEKQKSSTSDGDNGGEDGEGDFMFDEKADGSSEDKD
jgi:CDP-diacylglycerol--serine O-phosphatidyltransferase